MNWATASAMAGGIGMFLLGIHHLTEGMKSLAGDALRRAMQKLVSGTFTGLLAGASFTAIVQSSSAAILTVIGFVSAGLITHAQAVAVVLGANLGTTATSWLVAFFGLKINISAAALPMIGIGGFLWLLGKGRMRAAGAVLAGFGLIFTGIDYLQQGMSGIEWNLAGADQIAGGRWTLAAIGILMTIVMQSSSAAAATTLVALSAGTLNLDQCFAMIVGQNIGTTATALLAAIGGTTAVKRTAWAHVLFNAVSGLFALLLLGPLSDAARWLGNGAGNEPVMVLAAFHTLFNFFGILLFLPWLGAFSRFIERMIGHRTISAVERLGKTLSSAGGAVALESSWRALVEASACALRSLQARTQGQNMPIGDWEQDLIKVSNFIHQLPLEVSESNKLSERRARLWHALDHLRLLTNDLKKNTTPCEIEGWPAMMAKGSEALSAWLCWAEGASTSGVDAVVAGLREFSLELKQLRESTRLSLLHQLGAGQSKPLDTMNRLDHLRWFDGAFYHAWRLTDRLEKAAEAGSAENL
jgi:phosphate:Na+ symporter